MHLKNPKDFWAGIMFAAVGFAFAIIVMLYEYPMGTASRMGPGYFPFVLGLILGALGVFIVLKALVTTGEPIGKFAWRPILWILAGVVFFGLTAKIIGLFLAIIGLVIISAFGGHEFKLKEQLIAAAILAVSSVLVFVYGLKLPFEIWPTFFG